MCLHKFILSAIVIINISNGTFSQLHKLQPGDKVPDLVFTKLMNYSGNSLKLSDFKGKWIILDFWNVYCASCISAFPKMEGFLKNYKDKLQIITFTMDSREKIDKLKQRSTVARSVNLPTIYSDTSLVKLFPFPSPHHIWIDPEGRVKYITSPMNATEKNVKSITAGEAIALPDVEQSDIDRSVPLFAEGNGRYAGNMLQYSYLMGYIQGLGGGSTEYNKGNAVSIAYEGISIFQLYSLAYRKKISPENVSEVTPQQIILNVEDSSRYYYPNLLRQLTNDEKTEDADWLDDWIRQNGYCYGLRIDPSNKVDLYDVMAKDLDRLFNLTSSVEKRKVKCRVIKSLGDSSKLKTKGISSHYKSPIINDTLLSIKNSTVNYLIYFLYRLDNSIPDHRLLPVIVDETNIKYKIDIDIPVADIQGIKKLDKVLKKYNLSITEEEREINFLIIKEN